jgi:hypothetical protein
VNVNLRQDSLRIAETCSKIAVIEIVLVVPIALKICELNIHGSIAKQDISIKVCFSESTLKTVG